MKKALGLAILALLLSCSLLYKAVKLPPSVPTLKQRDSIVRLTKDGGTFCSGTVISDTLVLTAAHCVIEGEMFGQIFLRSGITLRNDDNIDTNTEASVYKIFPQADQSLLKGDFKGFKHAIVIDNIKDLIEDAAPGNDLLACGYPYGGRLLCNKLKFVAPRVFFWGTKGILIPGMSGGPVFLHSLIHGDILVAINTAMDENEAIVSPVYGLEEYK